MEVDFMIVGFDSDSLIELSLDLTHKLAIPRQIEFKTQAFHWKIDCK